MGIFQSCLINIAMLSLILIKKLVIVRNYTDTLFGEPDEVFNTTDGWGEAITRLCDQRI